VADPISKVAYLGTASISKLAVNGTVYTEQSVNAQRSIKSTSANDTAAGTGARTVTITYFDASLNGPFTEVLSLSGLTTVNTVATDICFIESVVVETVGTGGTNAGTLSLYTGINGTGTVFSSVAIGDNTTYYSIHYVSPGKTMYLLTIEGSSKGNNYLLEGNKRRFSVPVGGISYASLNVTAAIRVYGAAPMAQYRMTEPFLIYGPARFQLFAKADSTTTGSIFAGFTYYEI